ncbi:hypothetical protein YSA_07299 [Pseudomonas putida ND6]|uniref:Uncharacterized protein n=1 Tax=Pseudomonas putida ND6 TaxID=231023 RepID=I3UYZ6_PSEPU|nr:hypothetical protein YSA_07299 [Pseudomonas putida ND6]
MALTATMTMITTTTTAMYTARTATTAPKNRCATP